MYQFLCYNLIILLLTIIAIIQGFFGGHFSPIVGYLEDENLVAVFDVNHEYSIYLVDPRRLYDSVATHDITSGESRGYVVMEVL